MGKIDKLFNFIFIVGLVLHFLFGYLIINSFLMSLGLLLIVIYFIFRFIIFYQNVVHNNQIILSNIKLGKDKKLLSWVNEKKYGHLRNIELFGLIITCLLIFISYVTFIIGLPFVVFAFSIILQTPILGLTMLFSGSTLIILSTYFLYLIKFYSYYSSDLAPYYLDILSKEEDYFILRKEIKKFIKGSLREAKSLGYGKLDLYAIEYFLTIELFPNLNKKYYKELAIKIIKSIKDKSYFEIIKIINEFDKKLCKTQKQDYKTFCNFILAEYNLDKYDVFRFLNKKIENKYGKKVKKSIDWVAIIQSPVTFVLLLIVLIVSNALINIFLPENHILKKISSECIQFIKGWIGK